MTEVILTLNSLKKRIKDFRNCHINFIPTMGNLHFGHESLVRKAMKKSGISIVSIFINPLQFNDEKDFKNSSLSSFKFNKEIKVDNLSYSYPGFKNYVIFYG